MGIDAASLEAFGLDLDFRLRRRGVSEVIEFRSEFGIRRIEFESFVACSNDCVEVRSEFDAVLTRWLCISDTMLYESKLTFRVCVK